MLRICDYYLVDIYVLGAGTKADLIAYDHAVVAHDAQEAARRSVFSFNEQNYMNLDMCSALYADYAVYVRDSVDSEPQIFYYKEYDYDC